MKKFTKLLGIVLIIALVMSMGIMAWAEDTTGDGEGDNTPTSCSITINPNTSEGTVSTEYTYYELLKASINGDNVAYYLPVSEAGTALKNLLAAVTYTKTVDNAQKTVTPFSFVQSANGDRWNVVVSDDVADGDGELLAAALNTNAIKAAALSTDDFSQNDGSAVAQGLDAGYYLITSTLGTKLVLQTLDDVVINTKNEYHTNTKTASKTNMNVGDTVTYTITVHIPATAVIGEEVTVHDTLDEHLAIDSTTIAAKFTTVTPATEDGGEATSTDTAVTLVDGTKKATTETFAKKFTIVEGMLDNDVVITYDAELLSTAADDTGYVNDVFSNTSAYETVPVDVKVWTFDFDLDKNFSGISSADADKYEATFVLYPAVVTEGEGGATTTSQGTTAIQFISDSTGYVVADTDDKVAEGYDAEKAIVITVKGGDAVNVRGLEAGVYYLVETSTADGFNQLTDPVVITITDTTTGTQPNVTPSHTVSYKIGSANAETGTVTVENNAGTVLPSTGGIGTTIFYVVGSILVVAAGVLLITKKRMSREG